MVKNKKLLYILVPAVLGIWGAIGFSIFSHMRKPVSADYFDHNINEKSVTDSVGETYQLLANYRDPFKTGRYSNLSDGQKSKPQKPNLNNNRMNPYQNRIIWPDIKFLGMISNNKKWVALVRVNNSNLLMSEGDEKMKVRLIKLYTDSVIFGFESEQKTILKSNASSDIH